MPIVPDIELDRMAQSASLNETDAQKRAKLKKATQEFESLFIGMMFKQVRKGMEGENTVFGKSHESKRYQEMMDDTLSHRISESGNFGIGKTLYKRLEAIAFPQEHKPAPTKPATLTVNPTIPMIEQEMREKLASKHSKSTDKIDRGAFETQPQQIGRAHV